MVVLRRARPTGSRRASVPTPPKQQVAAGSGAESINRRRSRGATIRRSPRGRGRCQVPVPKSFQLPNGLTVLVNERPGLPFVSARLVVKTGSGANPADKPGLANFTAAMLDEGTGHALRAADRRSRSRSSAARCTTASSMDAIAGVGALAEADVPGDAGRCSPTSCGIPNFPQEEVERQRASRLAQPRAAARGLRIASRTR